ncbi:MAG: hypothetical protein WBA42_18050 [Mesorhizobium sp.]
MSMGEMTPFQIGLAVLTVTLAPAVLVFAVSGLSNLSVRYWRGRLADSDERAGE